VSLPLPDLFHLALRSRLALTLHRPQYCLGSR
jgi:hypothetical protein